MQGLTVILTGNFNASFLAQADSSRRKKSVETRMVTRCNCEQFQLPTVSPNKSLLPVARQQASPNVAPSDNRHEELRVRGDGSPLPCLESAGATGPNSGVVGRTVEGPLPTFQNQHYSYGS